MLIDAESLSAHRPDRPLFTDVSVSIDSGDRLGVVGLNGCGKSTLLRMLARQETSPTGEVRWGRGLRLGVLPQQPVLADGTVAEALGNSWEALAVLDRLGMGSMSDSATGTLSGGQAKRVALAQLLAGEHDALILDEPTNHLDLDGIQFLETWLRSYRGGIVLVTHDRHVLDAVTTKVFEIDRGSAYLHTPTGWHNGSGYAAYLDGRALREEQAAAAEQTRRTLAAKELAWLRRGAPARTAKPKARIATATALVNAKALAPARQGEIGLSLGAQRLGKAGVEFDGVSFRWPDGSVVLDGVNLIVEPGDRIGIVGPNGAGKSTLLDLLAGRRVATAGTVRSGSTVHIGYYDQLGSTLDLTQRVRDAVAGDKGEPSWEDVALMRRFWFDGDAQFAPIGLLSGGERRRLQLLLTLVQQPNVLLLDEPTNDLDLDTLRAIEEFLETWPGIVVTVSHDRAFLDRVTDELLVLDGDGSARWMRGGVAAWLAERAASPSAAPARDRRAPSTAATTPSSATTDDRRSPSTIRRFLGQAERAIGDATVRRDAAAAALAGAVGHEAISEQSVLLAAAQAALDQAESAWLALADEAERRGLDV
jgi:ATP-binding cassette subfamily F protein uup